MWFSRSAKHHHDANKDTMIVCGILFPYNCHSNNKNHKAIPMKKWIILAASSFFIANVQANESFCGYKDYFHLSDQAHPAIYIVSGFSEPDIILQLVGPRSFVLRDTEQCRSGYAHVTVAYDNSNWCVLDIKDGPYNNHPTVTASCNGIRYMGIEYDGFTSHSYTINLD